MKRKLQILLAWCELNEAISALRNFHVPEAGADVTAEAEIFRAKQRAMQERTPYAEAPMPFELLPTSMISHGQAILDAMPPDVRSRLTIVTVDLSRVISFQKSVSLEGNDERFAGVEPGNIGALCGLCLPPKQIEEDLSGTFDRDGKGITLTSLNPNLRVGPVQSAPLPSPGNVNLMGFPVIFGSTFLHVVEYKGRYFLKDGYHRSYGLLQRGITQVPVVLQRAQSFSDVHAGSVSSISQEHLLGAHPPMLSDFFDLSVSMTVEQQAFRKVVRIRAEEFVVNL